MSIQQAQFYIFVNISLKILKPIPSSQLLTVFLKETQHFTVSPRVHMDSSGLHPKCVFGKDYLWYVSRVWVRVRLGFFKVRLGFLKVWFRFRLGGILFVFVFYCLVYIIFILFCIFLHKESSYQ